MSSKKMLATITENRLIKLSLLCFWSLSFPVFASQLPEGENATTSTHSTTTQDNITVGEARILGNNNREKGSEDDEENPTTNTRGISTQDNNATNDSLIILEAGILGNNNRREVSEDIKEGEIPIEIGPDITTNLTEVEAREELNKEVIKTKLKLRNYYKNEWEYYDRLDIWQELHKLYIPPLGKHDAMDITSFSLTEEVERFLQSKNRSLLITGASGSGKSVFVQMFEKAKWKEYDASEASEVQPWIPIYIALASLKNPTSELVNEHFINEVRLTNQEVGHLKGIKLLFILDGYCEIPMKKRGKIYMGNGLHKWTKSKVIITCRDGELPGNGEVNAIQKAFAYPLEKYFQKLYVAPFGDKEVKQYLTNFLTNYRTQYQIQWNIENYLHYFQKIPALRDGLAKHPVFLRLTAQILPGMVEEAPEEIEEIDSNDLFEAFVESWFTRAWRQIEQLKEKVPFKGEEDATDIFWTYAVQLASYMGTNKSVFTYNASTEKEKTKKKPKYRNRKEKPQKQKQSDWDIVFGDEGSYPSNQKQFVFHALPLYKVRGGEAKKEFDNKKMVTSIPNEKLRNKKESNNEKIVTKIPNMEMEEECKENEATNETTQETNFPKYKFWHSKMQNFFWSKNIDL